MILPAKIMIFRRISTAPPLYFFLSIENRYRNSDYMKDYAFVRYGWNIISYCMLIVNSIDQ